MQDRRRQPRLPSHVRVWVACPARTLFTRVHDVSSGGLGLHVPSGFRRGEKVKLTLNGEDFERVAVVAWVEETGFGLRFLTD